MARVEKLCLRDQVWTTAAPLPSGRTYASAVVQNGQLYVIGGYTEDAPTDEILRYDGIGDTWAVVAALSQRRYKCGVAPDDDGGIFVVGGYGRSLTVVERFDTRTLQVALLPPLPKGRHNPGVLATPGTLHVFGGWGSGRVTATRLSLSLTGAGGWTESDEPLPQDHEFAAVLTSV